MRKVVAVQPHRHCSRETPGAERCLVTEFLKSGGHFLLSFVPPFTEEDLGFVLFPKPLHAWTLHPPVTPTHTAEERCWAYELLRAGTSCAWSSALLNFRTDTLSWKHFQCQHNHIDISISPYLNGFSYCMCYWAFSQQFYFYHCTSQLLPFLPAVGWVCSELEDLLIFSRGAVKVLRHTLENDLLASFVFYYCTVSIPLIINLDSLPYRCLRLSCSL